VVSDCSAFSLEFIQSSIYDTIISGNEKSTGLITARISGPNFITGCAFGLEGSIRATVVFLIANDDFVVFKWPES